MTQDFDTAARYFDAALKVNDKDPRIHQNMALVYELQGDLSQADPHWNRFFDLLDDRLPAPSDVPHYVEARLRGSGPPGHALQRKGEMVDVSRLRPTGPSPAA